MSCSTSLGVPSDRYNAWGRACITARRVRSGSVTGTDNPAKGTDNPAKGTDNPAKGTDNPAKGTDNPAKGTDNPAKGTDNPATGSGSHSSKSGVHLRGKRMRLPVMACLGPRPQPPRPLASVPTARRPRYPPGHSLGFLRGPRGGARRHHSGGARAQAAQATPRRRAVPPRCATWLRIGRQAPPLPARRRDA
jgi:hypothetical protein